MDIIKELLSSPSLIKEVYGDLAKPGVSQVGKALGAVLGLGATALWPVMLLNEKARITLDANLERFRQRMENADEDCVVEVSPEIGVPISEKIAYVSDHDLSEMYLNLLESASLDDSAQFAHPSFVNIIDNLSPDEAKIVAAIARTSGSFPFIEVRLSLKKDKKEWHILERVFTELNNLDDLCFPANVSAYLSNLEGLGVIKVNSQNFLAQKGDAYSSLMSIAEKMYLHQQTEDRVLFYDKGAVEVTPFGNLFMKACSVL